MRASFFFCLAVTCLLLTGRAPAQLSSSSETIFLGTGEYNAVLPWDGILRFDNADTMNSFISGVYTPTATIPVKDCTIDTVFLNFAHGFYYHDTTDELYVSTLFTNQGNILTTAESIAKGAIAIFAGISGLDSGQVPTRYIFGDSTQLAQPHGVWLDESRDMLYVANTLANNILVFHNASTISGNVPPDRIISHTNLGSPVHIYVDSLDDILFAGVRGIGFGTTERVAIYTGASSLSGFVEPNVRIEGSSTRLGHINPTVHNVWYDRNKKLLAVAHHVNELLFFDLDTVNLSPMTPQVRDLTPRVVQVDSLPDVSDDSLYSAYGFHWDTDRDVMYVTVGYGAHMSYDSLSPPNVIKVYRGLSDSTKSGIVPPSRVIHWTNGDTYYPPQPIWVRQIPESTLTVSFSIGGGWRMLSVPVVPSDSAKTTLFPAATSAAVTYNAGYTAKDTLETGEGYWMKFGGPVTISISGDELTTDTITVGAGWNMVGTLTRPAPVGLISSSPAGLVTTPFFTYLGTGYVAHDTLRPGRGYWVKTSAAGQLFTAVSGNQPKNAIRIVSDGETPPPPPEGLDNATSGPAPADPQLFQNYPNPFNPATEFRFLIGERSMADLRIIDLLGRELQRIEFGELPAGEHSRRINAGDLASGVYFYRLEVSSLERPGTVHRAVRKMVIVR